MAFAGARGETDRQIADTLNYHLPQDDLHPAFNALDTELASRDEGARGSDDGEFRLNVANAMWGQAGCGFAPEYLDVLAQNYGAGMRVLDFRGAPGQSRQVIDNWISDQTEERIKDLVPEGAITPDTVLMLTNAIYFNAAWLSRFPERNTADREFHPIDGAVVSVPMMSQTATFVYLAGEGYVPVKLPYDGHELAMLILLPDEGRFRGFEETLGAGTVTDVVDGLEYREVVLTMPKFEFEAQFSLSDTLGMMGMPDAFDPRSADFSGMGVAGCPGGDNTFISNVIHKAFVLVEEKGTEEAAATAVQMQATSVEIAPPIEVTIDRPFMFLIRDRETDAILFVGRVETL